MDDNSQENRLNLYQSEFLTLVLHEFQQALIDRINEIQNNMQRNFAETKTRVVLESLEREDAVTEAMIQLAQMQAEVHLAKIMQHWREKRNALLEEFLPRLQDMVSELNVQLWQILDQMGNELEFDNFSIRVYIPHTNNQ